MFSIFFLRLRNDVAQWNENEHDKGEGIFYQANVLHSTLMSILLFSLLLY